MSERRYLAFDLGAGSGRAIMGRLFGDRIEIGELARFDNEALKLNGHIYWNPYGLYSEMLKALSACSNECETIPESVGIDTWGVDFALLAKDGSILGLPFTYRDPRTDGAPESFFARMPRERLYELSGSQILQLNTVFQLEAMRRDDSPLLKIASELLFMPDLFIYLLTGERVSEFTFATTSQLFNPRRGGWEPEIFETLGIDISLMREIVMPGRRVGRLLPHIGRACGMGGLPVVAVASHDTASAIAAVPAEGDDWAFISSGTWSLMGFESDAPIINEATRRYNFTNEGGASGGFRVLKNITGLWLWQQCMTVWRKQADIGYNHLTLLAERTETFRTLIDPDSPDFTAPDDMPQAIARYARRTGQRVPEEPGQIARACIESLALKYRMVLGQLNELRGRPIKRIHIIGGGAQNPLLCQMCADACGVEVWAGPVEATAVGNLLVQALSSGAIEDHAHLRRVVANSFEPRLYEPHPDAAWDAAYERFMMLEPK